MGIHEGHRQRLKAEFLARPDSFPDHKALELLLFYANPRSDTNPVAHELIERFGSLSGVLDAPEEEVQKVKSVGEHAAVLLKCVKEISRRYLVDRSSFDNIIDSTGTAVRKLRPYFFGARNERVYLLCMDGKRKMLGIRSAGEGSVNSVSITNRQIAEKALALNTTNLILAHNHTSGLAFPSPEDKATTLRLMRFLSEMDIVLVDHIILTDDDAVSLRDSGFFNGL
ncbi:DNA repair protein RadC [Pseudoflavonifractor sp. 524-17]|uniref:JAB domain-containing protein n=1 Tax=Pseudoflavonifractor sp. 524-17 TaxID=2304577 RepID=UPI001379E6DA|nr:JAB domain-containing protein [Pseudoflavonifractor sp. 524-17]NCE64747.1 DNA repair protein RadC [Pseudoflavonifractor sp. 524-17]